MAAVKSLVASGPAAHVVDLVFLAEGYTAEASELFATDVSRLVQEVFLDADATFRSLVPLFNIHSVFTGSAVTGVGKDRPKDPSYRLYREGLCRRRKKPLDPKVG